MEVGEEEEFDDGYDENLMGDEEDKKKLAQMTEKEREQELFNRSERRETLKIRFEIERKLRSKAKNAKKREQAEKKQVRGKKRLRASEVYSSEENSSDESDNESDKSVSHTDIQPTKSGSKMSTRSSHMIVTSSSSSASSVSPSSASSSGSSSESEQENDGSMDDDDVRYKKDDFQMTLVELKSLQLKRTTIEQWVYAPFFKETTTGLFVKISVGQHPQTKLHMYKVAQIIDITKGTFIYTVEKNRTDKQCVVRIGGTDRTFRMSFVSNRTFDEDDYLKWKDQMKMEEHQKMPSREHYQKKLKDLKRARNYEYKDEDIHYEVNERSKFKDNPSNFAMKKTELMGQKADAEASNDYEKARQIQQMIDDLEEKAKQLESSRTSSTFSAMSFVNERNRFKNIEESERVLKESKSVKTEDPFTRRKCTPMIVHNKNNGDSHGNQAKDKNNPDASNKSANDSGINNGTKSKLESLKSVDDLFAAHKSIDIELDIDI